MTTKYVVAPREPTQDMLDASLHETPRQRRIAELAYASMLAAIPDDPAAPIPVGRDEWGRIKRDAERWRKWQDRRKEHIIAKERGT